MERVNKLLRHPRFAEEIVRLTEIEKDRVFCGHGIEHLLDVARIAYIFDLESGDAYDKEVIYAAALLHDAGRARQYEDGTPHEQEGAVIAEGILAECGFTEHEAKLVLNAILAHRTNYRGKRNSLSRMLYNADKLSRRCYDCAAADDCDWRLKNPGIEY